LPGPAIEDCRIFSLGAHRRLFGQLGADPQRVADVVKLLPTLERMTPGFEVIDPGPSHCSDSGPQAEG